MFETLFSEGGLSLDRLRVLVEVHYAGGIAAAAPGLPIKQSQYSTQLRELSEFFGSELTQREGKTLKLTEVGVRLAELAVEQLQALSDLRAECRGRIEYRIGTGDGILQWLVIPRLTGFIERPGRVVYSLHNLRTSAIIKRVQETRLDFGVVRSDVVPLGINSVGIGSLEFSAIVPEALLSSKSTLSVADVFELPMALMTTDGQFTARLKAISKKQGVELQTTIACESFPQALAAVRTGRYCSILPRLALSSLDSGFRELRHAAFKPLARDLSLIWNTRMLQVRPLAIQVIEHMKEHLKVTNGPKHIAAGARKAK